VPRTSISRTAGTYFVSGNAISSLNVFLLGEIEGIRRSSFLYALTSSNRSAPPSVSRA
jgi:hypothetical protein